MRRAPARQQRKPGAMYGLRAWLFFVTPHLLYVEKADQLTGEGSSHRRQRSQSANAQKARQLGLASLALLQTLEGEQWLAKVFPAEL
ncbi:MAG TPA: hypothetical protein VHD63_02020 [Ktedonobacteraceae bacterium]|nr:hypothetical protein [Ktedonobacteraceae bacterium]